MASMEDLKKYLETSGYMLARGAKQFRENMPTVSGILGSPAEYLPGSGFVTGQRDLTEAARNAQTGNYGEAAIGAGNAALGYGSGILDMATLGAAALPRTMAKKAVEAVSEIAPEVIRAYHGSPYSFDKFDLLKIGSGEGAQAYGHGLYLAEAEPTAKYYRDTLAGNRNQIDLEYEANQRGMPVTREAMIEVRRQASGDVSPLQAAKQIQNANIEARQYPPEALADLIDVYRKSKKGSMYEVNIKAKQDSLLDYSKPLSEQSEYVRQAITKLARSDDALMDRVKDIHSKNANADQLYGSLTEHFVRAKKYEGMRNGVSEKEATPSLEYGQKLASDLLHGYGIQGIKYPDAMSKSKGGDTKNYVVFDDAMIEILRKYGLIPAVGAAGYGLLGAQDQAQAQETR